jgi:hypothetical protein
MVNPHAVPRRHTTLLPQIFLSHIHGIDCHQCAHDLCAGFIPDKNAIESYQPLVAHSSDVFIHFFKNNLIYEPITEVDHHESHRDYRMLPDPHNLRPERRLVQKSHAGN